MQVVSQIDKLIKNPSFYKSFYECAPDLMAVVLPSGKVLDCNQELTRVLGYSKEEIISLDSCFEVFYSLESKEKFEMAFSSVYQAEDKIRNLELMLKCKDNHEIPVICSATLIRDPKGTALYNFIIWHDISELVAIRTALHKVNQELRERNEELDTFAHLISHDLNSPLRAIDILSQWVFEGLEDKIPEEIKNYLATLRKRVERMKTLLRDIYTYYFTSIHSQDKLEKVDTHQLVKEVFETLDPNALFQLWVDPHMPVFVTRKVPLRQVFHNLMSNAVKHHSHPSQGRICISFQENGEDFLFSVSDNGPGIPPRFHQRIFEPLQRLNSKDKVEGTGLGLAIVKKILKREGGNIFLSSCEGQGATFSFTWSKEIKKNK
jgi:PAS domain S-box-containing protein